MPEHVFITESVTLSPETPFLNDKSQFHRSTSEETKTANNDDPGKDLHHELPNKYGRMIVCLMDES